jgi:anti-sigma factor RsiW
MANETLNCGLKNNLSSMHPNLPDILADNPVPVSNDQLVRYLSGATMPAERQAVEAALAAGGLLEQDGAEGLLMMQNKGAAAGLQHQIVHQLYQNLKPKQPRRTRLKPLQLPWVWLLVVGILALAILAWAFVYLLHH